MPRHASPDSHRIPLTIKLSEPELARLDAARGSATRPEFARSAILAALGGDLISPVTMPASRPAPARRAESPDEAPAAPPVPSPAPAAPRPAIAAVPPGLDAQPGACPRCHGKVRMQLGRWRCAGQCGRLELADGTWRVAVT